MKTWKKFLAFALLAGFVLLEACHRGYGCPGTDM